MFKLTSESLNFEWNLTVSTDGIFQAAGGVRVENFNVHFPVMSFTVDKTGPKVDGWTLTSDEFSFDVVKESYHASALLHVLQ